MTFILPFLFIIFSFIYSIPMYYIVLAIILGGIIDFIGCKIQNHCEIKKFKTIRDKCIIEGDTETAERFEKLILQRQGN